MLMSPKFPVSVFLCLFFSVVSLFSQEHRTEVRIGFRVNSGVIDSGYSDNLSRLNEIFSFFHRIEEDSTLTLLEVDFCASASPEGSYQLNRRLARERLSSLERLIRDKISIPDSLITRNDNYISWEILKEDVENCTDIPLKDSVLRVLSWEPRLIDYPGGRHIDSRVIALRRMADGAVWRHIKHHSFSRMRNAYVVFVTYKREVPVVEEPEPLPVTESVADTVVATPLVPLLPATEVWLPHLHIKSNAIGWAALISNIAVEADLAPHWSVSLPVYYSALNYFTSTIKFRTLAFQPELRYWQSADNTGFFLGAHIGVAWYNLAIDGKHRYQDHDGGTPALGGGLGIGYRRPLGKSSRWHIELGLGIGMYHLHYDTFRNESNGKLIDSEKKNYIGIDNAFVTFGYRLPLKKKGGVR